MKNEENGISSARKASFVYKTGSVHETRAGG
jgi:hypothetical protein